MKIWTLTTNDDNGICTSVCLSEEAANNGAWSYVEHYWKEWDDSKPMPDDWRDAMEALEDCVGFIDSVHVEGHDISAHPAIEKLQYRLSETEGCAEEYMAMPCLSLKARLEQCIALNKKDSAPDVDQAWIFVTRFEQINRRDVAVLWDGMEPVAYRVILQSNRKAVI